MRFMSRPEEKRLRRYVGRNYSNAGVEAPSGGVVGYPVGHMARGHIATGRFTMACLVIEENVGAKGLQKLALVEPSKKGSFVDPDIPCPQRTDHPFVRGRTAGGEQGGSDGRLVSRPF